MGKYNHDEEKFITKKALSCSNEDLKELGIEHSLMNINLPAMMLEEPMEDSISFLCEGKEYWFDKAYVESIDACLLEMWKYQVCVTAILLNAPRLFGSRKEEALLKKVIHPDYDWEDEEAYISAFSMNTEEGRAYYQAFVEFLSERYMRDDAKYGRITGYIVSNEVNSQRIWGNAGKKTVSEYAKEYTKALYVTWKAAEKYWDKTQVFLSLDHNWNINHDSTIPERAAQGDNSYKTYKGKDIVDYVHKYAKELGDFGWGIAYHPYPEDLRYPDFYHDRIPTFYLDTRFITFKNMEVLHEYLGQEAFLYEGKQRPIVLSEQGFNSRKDEVSELQGAAGYVLAYQKMKQLPGILWMTHHAYLDNPKEFGLNLGIRERNEDGTPGRKKPIYEVMRDMGTPQEKERVDWAKEFIGKQLYEQLINPEVFLYPEDKTYETEFGN